MKNVSTNPAAESTGKNTDDATEAIITITKRFVAPLHSPQAARKQSLS